MGAFVTKISGTAGILDAYVDEEHPAREYGSEEPDRLAMGEGKYIWISIRPEAGDVLPPGAHVLKAELTVLAHFPEDLDEDDVLNIILHRVTQQYSEATLSYAVFEVDEEDNGNWPPQALDTQELTLPLKLSDAQLM
jgi:hypothetical protein